MAIEQSEVQEKYAEISGISFEEYLVKYNSVEGMKTEWVGGRVESYTMSNNVEHQDIIQFLTVLFAVFFNSRGLGRQLLAGIPMKLPEITSAREPDLMIVFNEHEARIKPTFLEGPADLVVEVVSPESDDRDHGKKFIEYEAGGVPEYWLVDPLRRTMTIYALDADSRRYLYVQSDMRGRLVSKVLPNFMLDPQSLWQEPLPDFSDVVIFVEQMASDQP